MSHPMPQPTAVTDTVTGTQPATRSGTRPATRPGTRPATQPTTRPGTRAPHSPVLGRSPTHTVTTARTIRRLSHTTRTTRELAPLGIALRHFAEPFLAHGDLGLAQVHRATAVLTKQLAEALATPDASATVLRLVTDPDRLATVDGRTARELCGPAWEAVRHAAEARSAEALAGIRAYGCVPVLRLAALHAVNSALPWHGTPAWEMRVIDWLPDDEDAPLLRTALLESPEHIEDEILRDILS